MAYARKGRKVFPCKPDKKPLVEAWPENASTDETAIRQWWTQNPNALIGSPTGNGTVVIDIDGEQGQSSFDSLCFTLSDLPPTRTATTGKGKHLWFRVNGEVRNSAGKLGTGIDVRGDGGYVILPPSPHPNGKRYQWESPVEVAELPADWKDLLSSDTAEPARRDAVETVKQIPQGERNNVLASLAGTMRARGMSYEAILQALLAENKAKCDPPLAASEVERIAKSYSRYEPGPEPGSLRDTSRTFSEATKSLLANLATPSSRRVMTGIIPLDEMTGGYLPGELIVYTAETGVGKTLLAQQTRRQACRDGIHGLFVSAEMDAEQIASRELVNAAGVKPYKMRKPEHLEEADWSALRFHSVDQCAICRVMDKRTTTNHIQRAAREMRDAGNLGLLVMDYDELIDVDSQADSEMERQSTVAGFAKRLARYMEVPVILVSQLRKLAAGESADKASGLSRLYGSGAKAKHASIVVAVKREYVTKLEGSDTEALISVLKNRNGAVGRVHAKFDLDRLEFKSVGEMEVYGNERQSQGDS